MKAYVLHGINDLKYEEVEMPALESGWALVRVKAAGICSSDIPRIFTKGTYHFPTIPGHEFAGEVASVADTCNQELVGKKVGVFPLIPCRRCPSCRKEQFEMCENYDYVGSRRDGGFAEYVAVPVWNLMVLPEQISFEEAALMEPMAVALHAVRKLDIKPTDRVAIIGTGMIGFAAAQWAAAKDADYVCIVGRNLEKKRLMAPDSRVEYVLEQDLQTGDFDKVIEAVGTVPSISSAIRATCAGGTLVLMGNPAGDISLDQDVYWRILRKQITLIGTWNSSYGQSFGKSDWEEVLEAMSNRKIDAQSLISHCFSQKDMAQGLQIMRTHSQVYCRVLVKWNEE